VDRVSQWDTAEKAPNSKHQAPTKFQVPNNQNAYLFWNLKFGAFLGFGIWDLMLSCVL